MLSNINKIYSGCDFEHAAPKEPTRKTPEMVPRASTIKKVMDFILARPYCDRKTMLDNIKISTYGLDNCLKFLVKNGKVNRVAVGMCGPKVKNEYSLTTTAAIT